MGTVAKILGQSMPDPSTPETLYTVPALTEAQGTLTCCNQSDTQDTVQVALLKAGDELGQKHYVCYNTIVPANGLIEKSFDLGAGDAVIVYSTNGTTSMVATGLEVS